MNHKNKTINLSKIEIDEKTSQLKIVKTKEEYDSEALQQEIAETTEENKNNQSSIGKQLVMQKLLGFNDNDKSIDRRQKFFKHLISVIFIVFVVAVLGYTFYADFFAPGAEKVSMSFNDVVATFSSTWFYLIFAIVALICAYVLKGFKLSVICKSQTGKWHFKTCFETGIIGHYYNYVTPLAVGGQPFEIYHLSKHGVHGGVATSMPIIAFFFAQFAFVSTGVVSLILLSTNVLGVEEGFITKFPAVFNILATFGLVTGIAMPAMVLLFSLMPRIGASIVKWITGIGGKLKILKDPAKTEYKTLKTIVHSSICIKIFAKNPLALISTFIISIGETFAQCSIAYFTLKLFGYDNVSAGGMLEWLQIIQLCVILYASISFIPTPGNSGAADLSFYLLFTVGVKFAGLSFVAMVVWRLISYYSYIIIGFIFTTTNRKKDHMAEFLGISDLKD